MRNCCQPCNLHRVITRLRVKVQTESCGWVKKREQWNPTLPTHTQSAHHTSPLFPYSKRLNIHKVLKQKLETNLTLYMRETWLKCQHPRVCMFFTHSVSSYPLPFHRSSTFTTQLHTLLLCVVQITQQHEATGERKNMEAGNIQETAKLTSLLRLKSSSLKHSQNHSLTGSAH